MLLFSAAFTFSKKKIPEQKMIVASCRLVYSSDIYAKKTIKTYNSIITKRYMVVRSRDEQ